ncbi:MAG: hypothetical protein IJC73_08460 [Lentisphaeria bacterium]|nr:hypothetical protein [Lentisphaeria bacterium]
MIVPMLKTILLLPGGDRAAALEVLQELGVLHIEAAGDIPAESGASCEECAAVLAHTDHVIRQIRQAEGVAGGKELDGAAALAAADRLITERTAAGQRLDELASRIARLEPWGECDPERLMALKARGICCYLCVAPAAVMDELRRRGLVCEPVRSSGKQQHFVVMSGEPLATADLPLADVPTDRPLSALTAERAALTRRLTEIGGELAALRDSLPALTALRMRQQEALDLAQARAAMADHGVLTTLTGFVPEPEFKRLREAAASHGWGICCRPADAAVERVPTLLVKPGWIKLIDPLLKFLSLSPGYDEYDVSLPVLIFFTIFFGMLMGDAIYGTLILGGALAVLFTRGRSNPELRRVMQMMTVLGASSLIWGACSGNYGGMDGPGIPWLATDPDKNKHVQLICFVLALTHMSLAHTIRIICDRSWRNVLANLGWITLLCANFVLIYRMLLFPGAMPGWLIYGYIGGILAAAIGGLNFKDIGSVLGFPFDVISSFVDMLSYIRLFAVGLSGYYLANCFDNMAFDLMQHSWYGAVGGVVVLLCGQLLNVALCALGVLVHGVRLNTLEFSNHLGLRWTGIEFAPLRKHIADRQK